jgi:hypothetical protein
LPLTHFSESEGEEGVSEADRDARLASEHFYLLFLGGLSPPFSHARRTRTLAWPVRSQAHEDNEDLTSGDESDNEDLTDSKSSGSDWSEVRSGMCRLRMTTVRLKIGSCGPRTYEVSLNQLLEYKQALYGTVFASPIDLDR